MKRNPKRVLIYGYGNPGRQDDGLGVKMAQKIKDWIEEHHLTCMRTEVNYQLNIEDAEIIHDWDIVVFVDASKGPVREYKFNRIEPDEHQVEFSMHAVSPAYVLHLSEKLFGKKPETYVLEIRGFSWEVTEGLSDNAKLNMEQAFQFLTRKLAGWAYIKVNLPISMLSQ